MGVLVKVLEKDFNTGLPSIFYKTFKEASTFEVYFNDTQELTHLQIMKENKMLAFYPSGMWAGAELIKEKECQL